MAWTDFISGGFAHDFVFSIGSDALWYAIGPQGEVRSSPTVALVEPGRGRVVAFGDAAEKVRHEKADTHKLVSLTRHGGFSDPALASQVLWPLYRKTPGSSWLFSRRALAVCTNAAKPSVKQVGLAGSRAVITIPPPMAAALGAGLPIGEPRYHSVLVLDRDWCAYTLIRQNQEVAAFELTSGIDALLQDVAVHALATRGAVLDPEAAHRALCRHGLTGTDVTEWNAWLSHLEAGPTQAGGVSETDLGRSALPFAYRLRWQYERALAQLDPAKRREAAGTPLHLFGPYARIPGLADLLSRRFECRVEPSPVAEKAMVIGAQKVLADLRALFRGAKPKL